MGQTIDLIKVDIFQLLLEKQFACGYFFQLCSQYPYEQLVTEKWEAEKLASKTPLENKNLYLDSLYAVKNLTTTSEVTRILWLSDVHLDLKYKEGSSSECKNYRCCHEGDELLKKED